MHAAHHHPAVPLHPLAALELEIFLSWMTAFLSKLLIAGVVLLGFYLAGRVAQEVLNRIAARDRERRAILRLLGRVAKVTITVFGVVTALGTLGIEVAPMIAGLGLSGLGLALALKDVLTSTVSGIVILLSRPFHEGDHVTVAGFEGKVLEIDLRYTRLEGEGKEYLVPNSTVMTSPVTVVRTSGQPPGAPEPTLPPAPGPENG